MLKQLFYFKSLSLHFFYNLDIILLIKVRKGRRPADFLSCAYFLIKQPFLSVYRHTIHQNKAEYHSYLLIPMMLYNPSNLKLENVKEIEFCFLTFIFRTPIPPKLLRIIVHNLSQLFKTFFLKEACLALGLSFYFIPQNEKKVKTLMLKMST